ncbi:MAG: DNA primase [Prevotella sp.]|nr:DNA primase [Prevotella sp.]
MIDQHTIERIKDAADIVDVVSEFVSLKKVGANYRGLCPFHNDHTPSFYVSPSRRTCHCFVCGEGGDSVGFIMKHEQLTYPDALRWLAARYHIEIKERELTDEQKKEQTERESMFIVNQWAADYFSDILRNDIDGRAIGMQYFRQRGIRDDIIEKFKLGFCLSDRSAMSKAAIAKGYKAEYLIKTGLCYSKDNNGELVDRFAGRVMFPWIGISGKVVAFGGRVLDSRTKGVSQKYVNSPDSDIYHKDHELYGIYQAKKAIAKDNLVYMVEGYTDVISMHQCGIENVVANSGTALSEHQIHILHRFTPNIVLLYDGDAAGIKAAMRGTDMLLKEGMNVKVMLLPDGDDPDSFAKKHTAEEFRNYIKEHQTDFIAFKTKVLLDGVSDPRERSEAISSIIKSISVIGDPIVRAAYIQDCSARLGFNEQTLTAKMNEEIRNYRDEQRKEEQRKARAENYQEIPQPRPLPKDDGDSPLPPPINPDDLPPEAFSSPPSGEPAPNTTPQRPAAQPSPTPRRVTQPKESIPDLIMKTIITKGELILYDNLEQEGGGTISLTVAQFIQYDLALDSLSFSIPMYNRILEEAAQHSTDEGFVAERYFTMHPDYEISSFAIRITTSQVMVSESLKHEMTIEQLRDNITHLLYDFRNEYIETRMSQLRSELKSATTDEQRMKALLEEMTQIQKVRTAIAKKTGKSIVSVRP